MLTTKSTVRFATVTPALLYMLTTLERLSRTLVGLPEEGLVITSGSDSTHMAGSKHYTGEAIDVRSKSLTWAAKSALIEGLRAQLGPQFTVLLEHDGQPQEHLHLQVKKGRRFDPELLVDDANVAAIVKGLRQEGRRQHATALVRMHRVARRGHLGGGAVRGDSDQSIGSTGAVDA